MSINSRKRKMEDFTSNKNNNTYFYSQKKRKNNTEEVEAQQVKPKTTTTTEEKDISFDSNNFNLYKSQSENGDYLAMYRLGLIFYYGEGAQKDYKEALKWFKMCEEKSHDPRVQHRIALIYRRGYGVVINHYEAGKWFLKAAKNGNIKATYNLGLRYLEGKGFQKDLNKAFKYFLVAAEAGHVAAQFNIALMWSNGQGAPYVNEKEASNWFLKAANNSHPQACANMGTRFMRGIGVQKNKKEALKWFFRASELEHANSTIFLSALNKKGFENHFPKDTKTALTLYKCGAQWRNDEKQKIAKKRNNMIERQNISHKVEEKQRQQLIQRSQQLVVTNI